MIRCADTVVFVHDKLEGPVHFTLTIYRSYLKKSPIYVLIWLYEMKTEIQRRKEDV